MSSLGEYKGPLHLASIFMQQVGGTAETGAGTILLDDFGIREKGGIRRIVESFDSIGIWETLRDSATDQGDRLDLVRNDTHSGTPAARFAWGPRRPFGTRGIRVHSDDTPLPVLASWNFLSASRKSVGDNFVLAVGDRNVPAVIRDVVDYFPTLDPTGAGFVVAPLDATLARVNAVPGRPIYPTEIWGKLGANANLDALNSVSTGDLGARSLLSERSLLDEASSDPLVAAGWNGVLTLAFIAALLLSLVGFIVQSSLALQRRMVEFAILRTMGISHRQLLFLIGFEQSFLIVGGILAGTFLGLQIGSLMLPFLQLTERGGRVLPPFIITTQWSSILPAYALLFLFFAVSIGLMGLVVSRLPIGRTLRIGE
jgi:hypothetical protein